MSEGEAKCGLCHIIHDGLTTQIMSTLTGSTFLVAFAAALGASNLIIGLLAAIPALSSVIQIPAIYLVEKYGKRKSITVLASALSRSFLLVIACIPFVFPLTVTLPLIMVALVLNSLLSAIGGCSWNSWMHDLVPKRSWALLHYPGEFSDHHLHQFRNHQHRDRHAILHTHNQLRSAAPRHRAGRQHLVRRIPLQFAWLPGQHGRFIFPPPLGIEDREYKCGHFLADERDLHLHPRDKCQSVDAELGFGNQYSGDRGKRLRGHERRDSFNSAGSNLFYRLIN